LANVVNGMTPLRKNMMIRMLIPSAVLAFAAAGLACGMGQAEQPISAVTLEPTSAPPPAVVPATPTIAPDEVRKHTPLPTSVPAGEEFSPGNNVAEEAAATPTAAIEPTPMPTSTAAATFSGIPYGVRWILETLDGNPPVESTYATLTVSDDSFGGYDGCNTFSIRRNAPTPVDNTGGTTSPVVLEEKTLQLCRRRDGDNDIMEQADAYRDALREARSFRIDGAKLKVLDEAGEVRMVLVRPPPLPGRPIELAGTAWHLVAGEEGGDAGTPTLAFLTDHIAAGATACREYVAGYMANEGSLRFPSRSMIGSTEDCADELLEMEESFYRMHLSRADHYRVEESAADKTLRVRTKDGKTWEYESLTRGASVLKGLWALTAFVESRVVSARRTDYSHTNDVIPGTEATVEFGSDGVSGFAGCNKYSGFLSLDDSTLDVRVTTATREWCDSPDELMEQERRYLDILSRVSFYRVFGDRMSLHTTEDEALLFRSK
ncbi:MAG: META domain-containing protein, partial [Dehalococcoidia bacterium]|nr:META domain-containing protein [Dehalococcoidia bacterium]